MQFEIETFLKTARAKLSIIEKDPICNCRSGFFTRNPRFCVDCSQKTQKVDFLAKNAYNKDAKMDNYGR